MFGRGNREKTPNEVLGALILPFVETNRFLFRPHYPNCIAFPSTILLARERPLLTYSTY